MPTRKSKQQPSKNAQRLQSQHERISHAAGGRLVWAPLNVTSTRTLNVLDSAGADGTWLRGLQRALGGAEHFCQLITADADALQFPVPATSA